MTEPQETTLLNGRVRLLQPAQGYRVAIDPVLLAAAAPATGWETALDVGAGTGAVMLCLLARLGRGRVHGLELLEEHAGLAERSIALNGWRRHAGLIRGDLSDDPPPVPAEEYDLVLSNPPYHEGGSSSPHAARDTAHREDVPVADWLAFCLRALKPRGTLCLIHRADRLDAILGALSGEAGAVEVIPLWPRRGQAAKRVIVRAIKGRKTPMTLHAGLVLHDADGGYTMAADKVLRQGLPLDAALDVY